jgi:hypothetical protein
MESDLMFAVGFSDCGMWNADGGFQSLVPQSSIRNPQWKGNVDGGILIC